MSAQLRNRFLILLHQKEAHEQRRIAYAEIARSMGSSINIISNWANNKITRFDAPMVVKLCEYFGCEVGDLLYLERAEDGNGQN
jgi:DNA-binding Xre family transcriptional regulator